MGGAQRSIIQRRSCRTAPLGGGRPRKGLAVSYAVAKTDGALRGRSKAWITSGAMPGACPFHPSARLSLMRSKSPQL